MQVSFSRACPACESSAARRITQVNECLLLSCRDCQTTYSEQAPDIDYDEYYRPDTLLIPEFIQERLLALVATFEPHRKLNRLLDVGFGAAGLARAAVQSGWQVYGVEKSQSAVAHARQIGGLEIFYGDLVDSAYHGDFFDVVCISEVLEHLPEPSILLKEAQRILRPGGLCWTTTPHGRGISARLLGSDWSVVCPPEHLQLFSLAGIRTTFRRCGFSKTVLRTEGVNPAELLAKFRNKTVAYDRNTSGFELNRILSSSPRRRLLKSAVNSALRLTHLGDSVKIWGEK